MMSLVIDIASWICFIGGAFFLFIGSLGMIRLQDFWARLHAASIIDSAGAGLILFGMMLQTGMTLVTVKTVLIIGFLMITGPTASHAVANAAFHSGSRPRDLVENEVDAPKKPRPANKSTNKSAKTKKRSGTKTATRTRGRR